MLLSIRSCHSIVEIRKLRLREDKIIYFKWWSGNSDSIVTIFAKSLFIGRLIDRSITMLQDVYSPRNSPQRPWHESWLPKAVYEDRTLILYLRRYFSVWSNEYLLNTLHCWRSTLMSPIPDLIIQNLRWVGSKSRYLHLKNKNKKLRLFLCSGKFLTMDLCCQKRFPLRAGCLWFSPPDSLCPERDMHVWIPLAGSPALGLPGDFRHWGPGALTRDQGGRNVRIRSLALRLPSCPVIAGWLPHAPRGRSPSQAAFSTQGDVQIPGTPPSFCLFRLWVINAPFCCSLQGFTLSSIGFMKVCPRLWTFPHLRVVLGRSLISIP